MSEIVEVELIDIGPQVVFVDNVEKDAKPLEDAFNNLNIANRFIEVDYIEPNYPKHPLKDVKLIFLDLFLNDGFGADFDAYACTEWLKRIVPEGKKYSLIIWSKDVDRADQLLQVIKEEKVTYPEVVERKSKPDYLRSNVNLNIEKMLNELGINLKILNVQEYPAKILEVEENAVLINCLVNESPKVFEVRRFDLEPFKDYLNLEPGNFLKLKITTKPGSRTIDFENASTDLSEMFIKPDIEIIDDTETIDWLKKDK